jgi:hypothetical protein
MSRGVSSNPWNQLYKIIITIVPIPLSVVPLSLIQVPMIDHNPEILKRKFQKQTIPTF